MDQGAALYPAVGIPITTPESVEPVVLGSSSTLPDIADAACSLQHLHFPAGLASELARSVRSFPIRLWVLDNSGSMQLGDGSRLCALSDGARQPVLTIRW